MFLCRCGRGRKTEKIVNNEAGAGADVDVIEEIGATSEDCNENVNDISVQNSPENDDVAPQVREETYGANETLNQLVKKGLELRLLPYIKNESINSIRIVDMDRIYLSDNFRVFIKKEELIALILELINSHSKKKYKIYFEGSIIIFKEKKNAFSLNKKKITKVQCNVIDYQLDNLEIVKNPFIYIEEAI